MISKTDIEKLIKKKDETIIFQHQQKDIVSLKKSLGEFEEEYDEVKNDFGTVNYLLNLVENTLMLNMIGAGNMYFLLQRFQLTQEPETKKTSFV